MGFSVGDIFGKNFLSADTIIGGQKKTFKADAIISGIGAGASTATFRQALTHTIPGTSQGISHFFKKGGSSSHYHGAGGNMPSFVVMPDDNTVELTAGHDYGFNLTGANGNKMIYRIHANKNLGGSGHVGPATTYNGNTVSILTAANSSAWENIKKIDDNTVEVALTQGAHYISLDPGARVSGIGTFTIKLEGPNGQTFTFARNNSSAERISAKGGTPVTISLVSWIKIVEGCMLSDASNYNSNANEPKNSTCAYNVAKIESFTANKTVFTQGVSDSITFDWTLNFSNGRNNSSTKLFMSNNSVQNTEIKAWSAGVNNPTPFSYNVSALPVGKTVFKLVSSWDKNPNDDQSSTIEVTINPAETRIACEDPNASKYGELSSSGDCGSCNDGFSLHTDGLCQKVGCTTEGNYNYDETAVVHDESMCYDDTDDNNLEPVDCELSEWSDWSEWSEWSDTETASGTRTRNRTKTVLTDVADGGAECGPTEETETETKDPETGEITTTTNTDQISSSSSTATETSFPIIPVLGGVLLLGVLLLRR